MKKKDLSRKKLIDLFRVKPGRKISLSDYDPGWAGTDEMRELLDKEELKERAEVFLEGNRKRLADAQSRLYAQDIYSLLVVFQAMDAAGKDGMIKHVMSAFDPQGCQVTSFKQPTQEELQHDFIWRCYLALPEHGQIGIFNRSHYEEVLVVRVHPEYLDYQNLPPGKRGKKFWRVRYQSINNFERHLVRNGTAVVKFYLNISHDEQKGQFLERLDDPTKNWKFSLGDVKERGYWDQYMKAYEAAISATSTKLAPWYIIPADHKWIARALVSEILAQTILDLGVNYPRPSEYALKEMAEAQSKLISETVQLAEKS
jgi:PPK2 family polyphosphate:nucleotide phosphotransferase